MQASLHTHATARRQKPQPKDRLDGIGPMRAINSEPAWQKGAEAAEKAVLQERCGSILARTLVIGRSTAFWRWDGVTRNCSDPVRTGFRLPFTRYRSEAPQGRGPFRAGPHRSVIEPLRGVQQSLLLPVGRARRVCRDPPARTTSCSSMSLCDLCMIVRRSRNRTSSVCPGRDILASRSKPSNRPGEAFSPAPAWRIPQLPVPRQIPSLW